MLTCLLCDADIDVEEDELDAGDTLSCDECGATLHVVSTDPVELATEEEVAEDDDEDFDEDDDEPEEVEREDW
jgi:alpha-aminoadipate carrier protein LysW